MVGPEATAMSRHWIPAAENLSVLPLAEKPFDRLSAFSHVQFLATRDLPAAQRRLQVAGFVETLCWSSVRPWLPLQLPKFDSCGFCGCCAYR